METLAFVVYQVIGRPAGDGFNLDLVAALAARVTSLHDHKRPTTSSRPPAFA
jgi:hypothetical protein